MGKQVTVREALQKLKKQGSSNLPPIQGRVVTRDTYTKMTLNASLI
ncbi:hypothetical protein P7H14_00550 [Paenibacillus larvae]|nr:hypothetical protein [Paenibacillus larvae]MDT2191025.1 hypothetical protein [Paenibacillus larvae]MDT2243205.1 hypothetical protein [Paenibacillus larvae]